MNDNYKSWDKFFNPKSLRGNLIDASLYISAFELCKDRIIELPKLFFSNGYDKNGLILGIEYKNEILSLNKSVLYASLFWFKRMGAIKEEDIQRFNEVKKHRNEIVHELASFISSENRTINSCLLMKLVELIGKIEKWWVLNIEMTTNPDFDNKEINENDIKTGTVMIIQLMQDIATGNEPEEEYYYKMFKKITSNM